MRAPLVLLLIVTASGSLARAAHAQTADDVRLPPITVGTAASFDLARKGASDVPGGAGAILTFDGNVNRCVAVVTELAGSPRMRSIMVGGRVSTPYFREGAAPRIPGRFFAETLAGRNSGGLAPPGAVVQVGVGADLLVVPRGLALRWALDYLFSPSARHDFNGARFSIGIVVGPRLRHG